MEKERSDAMKDVQDLIQSILSGLKKIQILCEEDRLLLSDDILPLLEQADDIVWDLVDLQMEGK